MTRVGDHIGVCMPQCELKRQFEGYKSPPSGERNRPSQCKGLDPGDGTGPEISRAEIRHKADGKEADGKDVSAAAPSGYPLLARPSKSCDTHLWTPL
jgi:hypothetical protein